MLSVSSLADYLSSCHKKIGPDIYGKLKNFEVNVDVEKKIPSTYAPLPSCLTSLFGEDYYYNNEKYRNTSTVFSFLSSLFFSRDTTFSLFPTVDKEDICKAFIRRIDDDMYSKDLYAKFSYTKNKKFTKKDIGASLKDAYQFKSNGKFHLFEQYVSDYLGINLYVFHIENTIVNYEKSYFYLATEFGQKINRHLPNVIMLYINNQFRPIVHKNDEAYTILLASQPRKGLLFESQHDIIQSIWNYFTLVDTNYYGPIEPKTDEILEVEKEPKYVLKNLGKLKMTELSELCELENISLTKESDKTKKQIKKSKTELIDELLQV